MAGADLRGPVLGLGDSITSGPGDSALNVPPRPWSQWLAEALDLPFHRLARDGALASEIAVELLPRARFDYALACVHVGTNDVRSVEWDAAAFTGALATILDGLRARRTVVATVPLDLGRPRAGAKVADLNAIVRREAGARGACVVALDDLRGWRQVMPDAVHLTALGQLAVADRAAAALDLSVRPSSLVDAHLGARSTVRYAISRQVPMIARDLRRRAVDRWSVYRNSR